MTEATATKRNVARLDHLDALRGVMIVFVVGIHAFGYVLPAGAVAEAVWWIVSTPATAAFFLVDGVITGQSNGMRRPNIRAAIAASCRRLLLPWLIFTVAYGSLRIGAERAGMLTPIEIDPAMAAWQSLFAPQLYFLVSLFIVRISGMVLLPWLARRSSIGIGIMVSLVIAFPAVIEPLYLETFPPVGIDPLLQALRGLVFFSIGVQLVAWRNELLLIPGVLLLSMAAALAIGAHAIPGQWGSVLNQLGYLTALYWAFERLAFLRPRWLVGLGRETMAIFLFHAPLPLWAMTKFGSGVGLYGIPAFFIVVFVSVLISVAIGKTLRRLGIQILLGETHQTQMPKTMQLAGDRP